MVKFSKLELIPICIKAFNRKDDIPGILHPDIRDLYAFSKLNKIQKEVVVGVTDACLKNPSINKVTKLDFCLEKVGIKD